MRKFLNGRGEMSVKMNGLFASVFTVVDVEEIPVPESHFFRQDV